jgi:hypothetical protein
LAGIEEGEGIGEGTLESKGVVAGRDAAEIETCSEEELKEFGTSLQADMVISKQKRMIKSHKKHHEKN